ncbi:MAG: hypothetical protein HQL01_06950 [Nitrospirae bacterium]|nr:hypothetical protein [Nitrospirota bacterium]
MKILINTTLAILLLTLIAACGGGSGNDSGSSGSSSTGYYYPVSSSGGGSSTINPGTVPSTNNVHNQAKDCLYCHNADLQSSSRLIIGGTMYLASSVTNTGDLNNAYSGIVRIQFLDNNTNVVADSVYYTDPSSKGYNAKGNLFILGRMMPALLGNYYIKLLDTTGTQIAKSNRMHKFTYAYNSANPIDPNNMYSCNACHLSIPSGGAPGLIYPNVSHNQGRDCLLCHNADPSSGKVLTVGATLYLSTTDSNNICGTSLRLQLIGDNSTVVYDTATYMNAGISGNYGKGNFSIMALSLPSLNGSYYINILSVDGTVLASSSTRHEFTSSYNSGNPSDPQNRYSCNTCHSTTPANNAPGLLYPNVNSAKCL